MEEELIGIDMTWHMVDMTWHMVDTGEDGEE